MPDILNLFAMLLLFSSMHAFVNRYAVENPRALLFLIIACACLVAHWAITLGLETPALFLLTFGAYCLIDRLIAPGRAAAKSGEAPESAQAITAARSNA